MRGSAAYVIPKIDVLASTVFQYRPGTDRNINITFTKDQVVWEPSSASRATLPCTGANAGAGVGCFIPSGLNPTATTYQVNVVDPGDLYTEGYFIFDLKLAKNIRFANKRLNPA